MKNTKHAPLPWWRDDDGFIASGFGENYLTVCDVNVNKEDIDDRENNLNFILQAVNCHDDLVEALEAVISSYILCIGSHQETPEMKRARTLAGRAMNRVWSFREGA